MRPTRTCAQLKEQIFSLKANDLVHQLRPLGNGEVLIERMEGIDAKALKDIAANIKAQKENSVVFLASIYQDKLVFVAGAGKGAIARGVRCGDLVKQAAMSAAETAAASRIWHKPEEKMSQAERSVCGR
ncbi:MAG: DHHA1 domain-containing protein [Merdibacter sp.]